MPETKPTNEPAWWGATPSWTPRAARMAHDNCQAGQLADAALLCDALLTDGRIRGVLETRKNALFGCELDFEPAGHKQRSTPIARALKDDGEFWEMAPESSLAQVFTWGLLLNNGPGELTWRHVDTIKENEQGDVVARDKQWRQLLTPKHPRNLRVDPLSRQWLLAIDGGKEIEFTPGDGRWVLFTPFGENNSFQRGLWYALALLWLSKSFSDFDWGRRNEARGRAALVGTTPEGSSDDDRDKFAKQLYELRTKLGIALPPGYGLSAVEFAGDDHQTFKARIDWADGAIGTLVLGQNLTADTQRASSLAAPKTNDKVRQDYLEHDDEQFRTFCRMQMLCPYSNVRYGDAALAPWPKWKTAPPEDVERLSKVWVQGAQALSTLIARGVNVDVDKYCEVLRIPLKKGEAMTSPSTQPKKEPTDAP